MRLAIQGERGSNHHILAEKIFGVAAFRADEFGLELELQCEKNFPDLVDSVANGDVDLGLMAIENSIVGSIRENYDLLSKSQLAVVGEGYLRIEHYLVGLEGADLNQITAAYSHDMALKQCLEFLESRQIEGREYFDTAAALPFILEEGNPEWAAITPKLAADVYGGVLLAERIETNKQNYTRFFLISKPQVRQKYLSLIGKLVVEASQEKPSHQSRQSRQSKVLLALTLSHEPGALEKALSFLAAEQMNLTKIESRPIPDQQWHYKFYLDFLSTRSASELNRVVKSLAEFTESLELFGIIPEGQNYQP